MARIPDSSAVSGIPSLRPSGAVSVADMSPIARGASDLASGIADAAGSLYAYAKEEERKENVVDVAAADAALRKSLMEIQRNFQQDNEFETFEERSNALTTAAKDAAARMIRDEETRQAWLGQAELTRLTQVEQVLTRGQALKREFDLAKIDDANQTLHDDIADPNTSPADAVRSTNAILENIARAEATGVMTRGQAIERRRMFAVGAQKTRAANAAYLLARSDPAAAIARLGVSDKPGDVAAAALAASGGKTIALPADMAATIAKTLGDESFPKDPADIAAYLTDVEKNKEYVGEAIKVMQSKLDGDLEAAVIALAPGGSLEMARKFQETGDEADLPAAVADFYHATMTAIAPAGGGTPLPILIDSEIEVSTLSPSDLDNWQKAQAAFGQQVRIVSGISNKENDAAGGRPGLNLDVSKLSTKERERLLVVLSTSGFSKIGIYKDALHIETGDGKPEVWGPKGGNAPAWAEEIASQHMTGTLTPPIVYNGRDPEFAAADYKDLLAARRDAEAILDQERLENRAWINTAVTNMPSAIANGVPYEGKVPTAIDFVNAYGAVEGIERWNAFEAQVDLETDIVALQSAPGSVLANIGKTNAEAIRNAPADQIALIEQATAAKTEAAKRILEAREKDPASATLQAFPEVKKLWDAAVEDPSLMPDAVKAMATAQTMLEIPPDKQRLLPEQVASTAVESFKNLGLPDAQRQDAILATVALAGGDEDMQDAIVGQLVTDAGAPRQLRAALAPLEREDRGAEASARTLLSAMMTSEEALGLKKTGGEAIKPGIETRIAPLSDDGGLASVMYGLDTGSAQNLDRWNDDRDLLIRATAWHMARGNSEEQAAKLAVMDMYGDIKAVTDTNVRAIVDGQDDDALLSDGFFRAMAPIKAVLKLELDQGFVELFPEAAQNKFLHTWLVETDKARILDMGFWANGPKKDTFVFVDGATMEMVPDPEDLTRPYTLTKAEVEAMGRTLRASGGRYEPYVTRTQPLPDIPKE